MCSGSNTDYKSSEPLKTLVMLCYSRVLRHVRDIKWRFKTGCKSDYREGIGDAKLGFV